MDEEILQEIEAVEAVYGSDCEVLQKLPPHLKVNIKPRTAEDLSQQFVEAVLVINANTQYPLDPPELKLIDSKGLDDSRRIYLLTTLENEAKGLASSPMLVALCEAAIDRLSDMNHPEGNCSFCLFPLVMEDDQTGLRPFMKLMSCFHCFHSDCFGRWWRWFQEQNCVESSNSTEATASGCRVHGSESGYSGSLSSSEVNNVQEWRSAKCPVCRKPVHAEDVHHVRDFLTDELTLQPIDEGITVNEEFLLTDHENKRREKFAEMFKVQQDRGGIIEPKKLEVILPGMFLPNTAPIQDEALLNNAGGVCSAEELNLGEGSVEPVADMTFDIPSSSTGLPSAVRTSSTGGQTAVECLDGGARLLKFGRRGQKNYRRHYSQHSSHEGDQPLRQQRGAQPEKRVWMKKGQDSLN